MIAFGVTERIWDGVMVVRKGIELRGWIFLDIQVLLKTLEVELKVFEALGLFLVAPVLVSCATKSSVVPYSAEGDNLWFIEHSDIGAYENRLTPIFCMSNRTATGADPKCYRARTFKKADSSSE
jgi:hypothetical protein